MILRRISGKHQYEAFLQSACPSMKSSSSDLGQNEKQEQNHHGISAPTPPFPLFSQLTWTAWKSSQPGLGQGWGFWEAGLQVWDRSPLHSIKPLILQMKPTGVQRANIKASRNTAGPSAQPRHWCSASDPPRYFWWC